jgi:hypothetical protein
MLPSKDDGATRVTTSSHDSIVDDRVESHSTGSEDERLAWKEQALVDLKLSRHRDT